MHKRLTAGGAVRFICRTPRGLGVLFCRIVRDVRMISRTGLAGRVNASNAKWYTLGAACFGLFMAILDNLVVNIAMPTIARDLDAKTSQLQWIVSAYTLVFASLQITAGGLGDRQGRKRWFMAGLALFSVTSLA